MNTDKLWIVAVISNPQRYRSRFALYQAFEDRMRRAGANLMTVEAALGGRGHTVTTEGHARHLQVRQRDELWHKENLINLGIQCLPEDWEYVAWLDADIELVRPDWLSEIVHQLQHYQVLQVFQDAIDLGPAGQVVQKHNGFMWSHVSGQPKGGAGYGYPHWHPGFGWAARRSAIDALGGLMDHAILGSGDHHMAWALLGKVIQNAPKELMPAYLRTLRVWEARARTGIKKDVGFMPGTLLHHWHGKKADRRYQDRWKILLHHRYDPDFDVQKDWQGVLQLSTRGERMRADLRGYFQARNEDSIDL